MEIFFASDHAGFDLKNQIILNLNTSGFNVKDFGTNNLESCSYSDYAKLMLNELAKLQSEDPATKVENFGILICGSGIGMSMVANRYRKIRAALCHNLETAKLSRQHNNGNVLCLGARQIEQNLGIEMVNIFLKTNFEGDRHAKRLNF